MRSILLVLAPVSFLTACANYDERMQDVHSPYYDGRVDEAILELQEDLEDEEDDRLILSLELAMAYQSADRYAEASQLLIEVGEELEVFDYTTNSVAKTADFVFGGEVVTYRSNRPERVMVSTQNMINFLALGDLERAGVEARRAATLLTQEDVPVGERYANGFVWGLGGFTLEMGGRYTEAEEFYWGAGDTPLAGLSLASGQADVEGPQGTILVVAQTGKVPIRVESSYVLFVGAKPHRLNLPTIVPRPSTFTSAHVTLDGAGQGTVPVLFDLGEHMRQRFDEELPYLLAAAAAQAGVRAATTEVATEVGQSASDDQGLDILIEVVGAISEWIWAESVGADTRCWSLLPERYGAMRLNVAPGRHEVVVSLDGRGQRELGPFVVDVAPGGLAVINVNSGAYEGFVPVDEPGSRDMSGTPEGRRALALLQASVYWTNF